MLNGKKQNNKYHSPCKKGLFFINRNYPHTRNSRAFKCSGGGFIKDSFKLMSIHENENRELTNKKPEIIYTDKKLYRL